MSVYTDARDNGKNYGVKRAINVNEGLNLHKPSNAVDNSKVSNEEEEVNVEKYKDSNFYKMFVDAKGKDYLYNDMLESMTPLISTLRNEVQAGKMPQSIAESRIQEALNDHRQNSQTERQEIANTVGNNQIMGEVSTGIKDHFKSKVSQAEGKL